MVHIHKKIHHHIRAKKHAYIFGLLSVATFFIIIGGIFVVTRGTNPHISELAFTEHSILGKSAGSVIPASCESAPWLVANGDGNYTDCATVACWDGSIITPAAGQTCPTTSCAGYNGTLQAGATCAFNLNVGVTASGNNYTSYSVASPAGYTGSWTWSCSNTVWTTGPYTCTPPAPVVTLNSFSPDTIAIGQSSNMSFSSTNATSCTGNSTGQENLPWNGNLGMTATPLGGAPTGPINTPGIYTQYITCTGPGGTSATVSAVLTVPQPSGTLNVTPPTCLIPINSTTCINTANWNTYYIPSSSAISLVDGNFPGSTLSTLANSPGLTVWVAYPQTVFNLKRNSTILDTKTVTSSCASGSAWNGPMNKCKAFPPTISATLNGNRTPSGSIDLTCTNASSYSVTRQEGGTPVMGPITPYTAGSSATVPLTISGNYIVSCIGYDVPSATKGFFYATYPLLPSEMSITAMPKTIGIKSVSSLSWSITNSSTTCMITAAPVCTGACSQSRLDDAATINSKLQAENTDTSDIYNTPGVARTVKNAIKYAAPNNNPTGFKALGKKTIPINFTTDFTLDCGPGTVYEPLTPKKARVQVTVNNEG